MSESNYEKLHSAACATLNDLSDIVLIMKIDSLATVNGLIEQASYWQIH